MKSFTLQRENVWLRSSLLRAGENLHNAHNKYCLQLLIAPNRTFNRTVSIPSESSLQGSTLDLMRSVQSKGMCNQFKCVLANDVLLANVGSCVHRSYKTADR